VTPELPDVPEDPEDPPDPDVPEDPLLPASPIGAKATLVIPLASVAQKLESKYKAFPIALATVLCTTPSFQYLTLDPSYVIPNSVLFAVYAPKVPAVVPFSKISTVPSPAEKDQQ
jgi:hypothetical protein